MRAVILTGGIYHDFDHMSAALAGILATAGLTVEIVGTPTALAVALTETPAALVVVQALHWRMLGHEKYEAFRAEWAYAVQPDLTRALDRHAGQGGGIIALHTGCICFDDWPGWLDLLGGGWVWGQSFHAAGLEPVSVTPVGDHPVTQGLTPFTVTDEHYRALRLDADAVVLAQGRSAEGDFPVAWAHRGPARTVTVTIGHDVASVTEPGQAALIRNAALWAIGPAGGRNA